MSNREWIDERHYRIKHVRTLDNGTTEEFYVDYVENCTKTHNYLTPEFEKSRVKMHNGGTGSSTSTFVNGKNTAGKIMVWEDKIGGPTVQICKMEVFETPTSVTFRYTRMDGTTFEHVHPWPAK